MQQSRDWHPEEVLVTVKAYPNPSKGYRETSCVAGITRNGSWIRLHPIPFRLLTDQTKFRKYDILRASVSKSSDTRPESHKIDCESIEIVGRVETKQQWRPRDEWVRPLVRPSLETLQQQEQYRETLGVIRVADLSQLVIERQDPGWSPKETAKLRQMRLFDRDIKPLERPPFKFFYKFRCDGPSCQGHRMQIFDWEVIQSYRSWRGKYGPYDWERMFRQKYEGDMSSKDLHFFVGTLRSHPQNWTIIGLYYPPRRARS